MEPNAAVMEMVLAEILRNLSISAATLWRKAKREHPDMRQLTLRQFHAQYYPAAFARLALRAHPCGGLHPSGERRHLVICRLSGRGERK